ncbi:hypothetical protein CPB86DRAFT_707062 [Serendipita vermifera]|nr:hypothetical protein CPB86DRAFT_707062 [Serendipita vermifera]
MDPDSKEYTRNPASQQQSSERVRQTRAWDSPSEKLDPELRAMAWFICNICQSLEPRYRRRGVFDFRGMCAHQCQRPDCSKKNPLPWAITNFTPALHAIETTRAMLKILGLDEEDPGTTIECFDGLWLCKNCPGMMKEMEWEDLVHHCSRHSTQRLERVSLGDAMDRKQARIEGKRRFTVSHLLSNKKEGEKKRLLCIHCMSSSEALLRAKLQVPGQIGQISASKVMDIHGIRQHLKVKFVSPGAIITKWLIGPHSRHEINNIRNEDIYFMDGSSDELVKRVSLETGNGQMSRYGF